MLYGRPSDEKPHGTQVDGTPARSIGIVNSALRGCAADHALWYSGSDPTWSAYVMGHAGSPPAGPATASTDSSAFSFSRFRKSSSVSSAVFTSNRSPCEAYRWRFFQPRRPGLGS